jgi:lipoprotein-releasing system permease protein
MSLSQRLPYELLLGWRYTRAGRAARRNGFVSFISVVTVLSIALAATALIVVLSVMNGFTKDVTGRMLSVISHIEVFSPDGGALPNPQRTLDETRANPEVIGAAPFIGAQALLARGDALRGVVARGIDPAQEPQVTDIAAQMQDTLLPRLKPGGFGILLGSDLARRLGVMEGDQVTLMAPSGQVTPAGVAPRLKQMTVLGTFTSGHSVYDSSLALLHIQDAGRIFRLEGPTGIRLKLRDLYRAPEVTDELAATLSDRLLLLDWTRQDRVWFTAVKLEKRMMWIILTMLSTVAAFTVVITLVMTVREKRADIAILRTLGASPGSIMAVFMTQGALVGVIGTLGGVLLGLLIACNIDVIVPFLERLFHTSFLPKDVYLINHMPSDPRASDIAPIAIISLLLSFIFTLYPSWSASRVNPAEALRYE